MAGKGLGRPKPEVIDSRSSSLHDVPSKETPKTPPQEKSKTVFPVNPIRNLIQIYEGGDKQDRVHGQSGEAGVTKGKTTFTRGGGERTPDTASCVDEFLASASKARSKYQKMLETPPTSPVPPIKDGTISASVASSSNTSPVLPAPATFELADGCFTDVSYAGSFASWQAPLDEQPPGGGNTPPMGEEIQNINSGTFTEISYAGSFASSKSPSSSSSSSPVQPEKPPTPPPAVPPRSAGSPGGPVVPASPRHRRRQRREQLLQEHKTLGREIVLTALRKEEKAEVNQAEEQKRQVDEKKKRELDHENLLRKILQEREEEISDLRSACEAWRQKTIASEKDLAEANFTVDKLER